LSLAQVRFLPTVPSITSVSFLDVVGLHYINHQSGWVRGRSTCSSLLCPYIIREACSKKWPWWFRESAYWHDFCGHGFKHGIPSSSLQSRPSMQLQLTKFAIAAMQLLNFIDDDEIGILHNLGSHWGVCHEIVGILDGHCSLVWQWGMWHEGVAEVTVTLINVQHHRWKVGIVGHWGLGVGNKYDWGH